MFLLLWSILLGAIGFTIGLSWHSEATMILFGLVGFFSPSIIIFSKLYEEIKKKNNS
jgi:hypothetical protein